MCVLIVVCVVLLLCVCGFIVMFVCGLIVMCVGVCILWAINTNSTHWSGDTRVFREERSVESFFLSLSSFTHLKSYRLKTV